MGEGIRTALAMLVAEELDIDWSAVRIVQADADSRFWDQQTGGSVSVSTYYNIMRRLGQPHGRCCSKRRQKFGEWIQLNGGTEAGFVIHPDGTQKRPYGELVEAASKIKNPKQASLKESQKFNIIGKTLGHWDAPQIVTGKAIFGLDVRLPGMLFAAIARCPVFGGKFVRYDDLHPSSWHHNRTRVQFAPMHQTPTPPPLRLLPAYLGVVSH